MTWYWWTAVGAALYVAIVVPLALLVGRIIRARDAQVPRDHADVGPIPHPRR